MGDGLAERAIEGAAITGRTATRRIAGADFDDSRRVEMLRPMMNMRLGEKRLQRKCKRDQQREDVTRRIRTSPDIRRSH